MNDFNTGVLQLFAGLEVTNEDVEDVKDAEFILPKLVVRGQSTVFIAEPNGGKTAVLVHLAPQIVAKGFDLVYMNFDAGAADIARHKRLATRDKYTLIAPDIKIGVSITDVLNNLKVLGSIPDLSGSVFIIDTLKKCTDVINKNSAKEFYNTLRAITGKGGTILIAGHANKYRDNDGKLIYEGTGDLRSDLDNMIFMEYQRDKHTQIITTYPDKSRAIGFEMVTFKMLLSDRTMTQLDNSVDIKKRNAITGMARRNDPDGDIRAAIKEAVSKGEVIQKSIVDYCIKHHYHSRDKVRKALKHGVNPDNQRRFLSVKHGDNNSRVYSLWYA